jgi:hypothetical protein
MTKRTSKKQTVVEIPERTPEEILAAAQVRRSIVAFNYQGQGDKAVFVRIGIPLTFVGGFWHMASLIKMGGEGYEIQGKVRQFDPLKMTGVQDFVAAGDTPDFNTAIATAYAKLAGIFKALDNAAATSQAKREREEKLVNERMNANFQAQKALRAAQKQAEPVL